MVTKESLGRQIIREELLLQGLLQESALVGGIYTMGFDECLVLTNDLWKQRAGGIPQHCFLLASAMVPGEAPDIEDEEVILLRVIGPGTLPAENELVQVRAEAMREMVTTQGRDSAVSSAAILDVLTRNEIQFSAVRAKILGTFYEINVEDAPLLAFGSDVDSYFSASRYKVYKPYGKSLAIVASYPETTEEEQFELKATGHQPQRVRIGAVRYSSTTRRHRMSGTGTDVPVRINVQDFVALKTAIFGMTRLGKSNAMKTIATAVFQHAAESHQHIGQLLFDPAGEYANVNVQDATALSQIGPEFVTIFRWGADGSKPGIRPLSSNFFSDTDIGVTWSIVQAGLAERSRETDYIKSFLSADVIGPANPADDQSAYKRAQRRRAALYATLIKAGFTPPSPLSVELAANREVVSAVNQYRAGANQVRRASVPEFQSDQHGVLRLNRDGLLVFWDSLQAARAAQMNLGNWVDPELESILVMYSGSKGTGYRLLDPLRIYHSPTRDEDYAEEIQRELVAGKIVIVDLSLGSGTVLKFCSERIINHIVDEAGRRFGSGDDPHKIQIFIEEAHQLFNRDKANVPEEADPYVRLAKEAAKYKIGLVYATQEVTSVDPMILSNTSNWIVTHLNNHVEVRELSKYYDFEDFRELTLKAEDVGFARLKARSGRYIIPVQIDLFSAARVQDARQAALDAGYGRGRE